MEIEANKISEIDGKLLIDFFVDVVEPEYNIALLVFDDSIYSVRGVIASELVGIDKLSKGDFDFMCLNRNIMKFPPFDIFLGRKVFQARSIGSDWNGHGFEISFEGLFNRTMIIQSIYAGDKPEDFHDCIRLGIGNYYYSSEADKY